MGLVTKLEITTVVTELTESSWFWQCVTPYNNNI